MRVLITGASGFAGAYLARACASAGEEVLGVSRRGTIPEGSGAGMGVDLRDSGAIRDVMRDVRPEVIYHLAALTSVGDSWSSPLETVQSNVAGDLNMLEAIRHEAPSARVVWVSSCQVYGVTASLPVTEAAPLQPDNPYGVSKASGDMLAGVYATAHRLDLVRVRPFNHTGPGQGASFIASSLARQAAQARLEGERRLVVSTGAADTRRDFTDVRDVVAAYRLLAAAPGDRGVYNVSSERSISAAEQVELLADLITPIEVVHHVDPARVRPHETPDLRGDHRRLTAATGWQPQIPFRATMREMIEWWERKLRSGASGVVRN